MCTHLYISDFICIFIYRGAQFRQEFSRIGEIRALMPPNTNIMALTTTANLSTQNKIKKSLEMEDCKIVSKIPNNLNICYSLLPMPSTPYEVLDPLIDEICKYGAKSKRTIVFCRSYDTLLQMYEYTVLKLNERGALFVGTPQPGKQSLFRTCDKYDACTSLEVRQNILSSFTQVDGNVRLIFATVAFAMGLDAPDVRRIIHWSPPDDIEMYIQESGRGGRDGKPSIAVLYVNNGKLRHALEEMKAYCKNTTVCRRALLMSSFDTSKSINKPTPLHMCCDICSASCTCSQCSNTLLGLESLTEFKLDDVKHELNLPLLRGRPIQLLKRACYSIDLNLVRNSVIQMLHKWLGLRLLQG